MLSEINPAESSKYCIIIITGSSLKGHIHNKAGSGVKATEGCGGGQWKVIGHNFCCGCREGSGKR